MNIPSHKTKIICTIGPASQSGAVLKEMIKNGMSIARLNFSHGDFSKHEENVRTIRETAAKLKRPVSILIDLPGVKMRIGKLKEPITLKKGDKAVFTARNIGLGTISSIPVSYKKLPQSVSKGSIIYLSDGFIQLKVEEIKGTEIFCRVLVGGVLLSHKGLNLPGSKIFVNPVTKADLAAIEFGLAHGINTFGLSFVENAKDIIKVRKFAESKGKKIYIIAKIERREAVENFDEILGAADAIMVARGDLGIEVPLEEVPLIQKTLIRKANLMGRPVITATQMLGSMTQNIRPTRAEVNDVANAIMDGTDALMLSEETAIGEYPVDAVKIMSRISVLMEELSQSKKLPNEIREQIKGKIKKSSKSIRDVISLNAVEAAEELGASFIFIPTSTGNTARHVCRLKPPCWVLSFSPRREISEFLNFSYGLYPIMLNKKYDRHPYKILRNVKASGLAKKGDTVIITEHRLSPYAGVTDTLGILTLE